MAAEGILAEYRALGEQTDADLLAMQMGDFYEFFEADARTVGAELDLKISQRTAGGEQYEMAGVPVDELTPYLRALVERGYRVAVADQIDVDGGHERRIDRVVTPGTFLETTDSMARYLAAIVQAEERFGLAILDVTTGQFQVTELDSQTALLEELQRFSPTELLPGPDSRADDDLSESLSTALDATISEHDSAAFAAGQARHTLRDQFGDGVLESVGIDDQSAATRAAGATIDYVAETGVGVLEAITRLRPYGAADHVTLDETTRRNLELTEPMTEGGTTLLETIDHTVTSAGRRLLAERLVRPTRDQAELERRLQSVEAFTADALTRERVEELLDDAYDLARLASRAASGSLGAPGLARVRDTLSLVPKIQETIDQSPSLSQSPVAAQFGELETAAIERLTTELEAALITEPSGTEPGSGVIDPEYDAELASVVADLEAAREWLDGLETREQRRHDFDRVSVGRTKTDGYYVELPKSASGDVPDHYEGIKTLKNAERYVFPELTERDREIRRLEDRRAALEADILSSLRDQIATEAELLQTVGRTLAGLDVHRSMADHAVRYDWARPTLEEGDTLDITAGRHPVVEQTVEFVPNDLRLDRERRFLLVTGPNMSGKSTFMRQGALIILLAQIGSFVPASEARIGLVDGIYTRVGAVDELAGGRSTFMVEMQELSNILHSATEDSLVVLDEVGRGTATYDGISIAWAATEYLHDSVGAKTLFATHYHELTRLADHLDGVANVHMQADERNGEVTFRRTVGEGPADRSYGVHVAELAGVPDPVVDRAGDVLDRLRADEAIAIHDGAGEQTQVVFDVEAGSMSRVNEEPALDPATEAILEELQTLSVTEITPVELLERVQRWQDQLEDSK